jgi:hypothetical protein
VERIQLVSGRALVVKYSVMDEGFLEQLINYHFSRRTLPGGARFLSPCLPDLGSHV